MSRRNAYFVASLAGDTNMTVTHNYAPTASFKTMVDGQGNVNEELESLHENFASWVQVMMD